MMSQMICLTMGVYRIVPPKYKNKLTSAMLWHRVDMKLCLLARRKVEKSICSVARTMRAICEKSFPFVSRVRHSGT